MHPADKPLLPTGGVVGLKGNLAPEGAIVKIAGMKTLKFSGPARCFDGEEACFDAVKNRKYKDGSVLVIRYEGPRGGPGMRGCYHRGALRPGRRRKVALITDGRFSAQRAGSASATSARRLRSGDRSGSFATATSSRSMR